jgi:hypothetical protein
MLKFTIGADISKDKINFALRFLNDYLLEKEIENTTSALNKFIKEVQSLLRSIAKEKKSEYSLNLSWNIQESMATFLLNVWQDTN